MVDSFRMWMFIFFRFDGQMHRFQAAGAFLTTAAYHWAIV